MQLFIDTAEIEEIKSLNITGLIDGVTTNPSLIAKSGRNIISTIEEICNEVSGPVSAEVTATDFDNMILEGKKLSSIAQNVAIKVPFSAAQALLAAKAGATFISPFIGRLDDIGADGMNLISEITEIYDIHGFDTKVLAASIRSVQDIVDSAKLGADVATVPPKFLKSMYNHPLTDRGLSDFLSDWKKTGQSIL